MLQSVVTPSANQRQMLQTSGGSRAIRAALEAGKQVEEDRCYVVN